MNESRTLVQIVAAHPPPWVTRVIPGTRNGMAQIAVMDQRGEEVPLITLIHTASIAASAVAAQKQPSQA